MIASEEYMDLMLNPAYFDVGILDQGCYIDVYSRLMMLYYPIKDLPEFSLVNFNYEVIPKCYTIMEEAENVADSISASILNKQQLTGENVIIGVIDTGIHYESAAFRNEDGTSRILGIWDQTGVDNPPEGFFYGSAYTKGDIDAALRQVNPQEAVPVTDESGHGTYLASVAAGSDTIGNPIIGIAPKADLAVVKLKEAKKYLRDFFLLKQELDARQPVFQENDIILALKYLSELAEREGKSLVVCLALGSSTGSFGAQTFLSRYIDYLSEGKNYIVTGTGNEANKRHHFSKTVVRDGRTNVEIRTKGNTVGFWMELWGEVPDIYSIGITSPGGDTIERTNYRLGETQVYNFTFEKTTVTINYLLYGTRTAMPFAVIRMITPSDGVWKIQINGERVIFGQINAFLPLTGFIEGETYFLESDPNETLTTPAGTERVFSFGAFDSRDNSIYYASGRGYPNSDMIKPDLVAQGVQVLGLNARDEQIAYSGTGVATAVGAGVIALFVQWAVGFGNAPNIGTLMVKNFLLQGADRGDNREYPNREWGYGAVDLDEALELFRYS